MAGYGTKSRCWFVCNPIAKIVERITPNVVWSWDVGRTVHSTEEAITLFGLDAAHEFCRANKITIYGMLGERGREGMLLL